MNTKLSNAEGAEVRAFGPGFVLGGAIHVSDLNFRFEAWSKTGPISPQLVDRIYATWRRASRKNAPRKNQTVRVRYLGDP